MAVGKFVALTIMGPALAMGAGEIRAQDAATGRTAAPVTLEEVIVTTTRREESVHDVPQSVSVLTEEDLAKHSIISVDEYTSFVPGLSFNRTGFGDRAGLDLTVRGISNTRLADANAGTGALTTGFYIDDIAIQPVDVWMYDVERLEVLKGPQGTLFGQASMGGTVRVITNKPDPSGLHASAEITGSGTSGGDPSWGVRGMLNLPLISGKLALRLVAYNDDQGGFIDWRPPSLEAGIARGPTPGLPPGYPDPHVNSSTLEEKNVNSQSTRGFRAALRFTPTERLTVTPFFMWQEKDTKFSGFIDRNLNQGYVNERYVKEPRLEQFSQAAVTIDYDFSKFRVTSTTGRFERDYAWTQDSTTFISALFGRTPSGDIASVGFIDSDYKTKITSEEIRLVSARNSYLDWVVGAAYFDEKRTLSSLNMAPDHNANVPPAQQIRGSDIGLYSAGYNLRAAKNTSVYADLTLKLFQERLQLSAGARRYENESSGLTMSSGHATNGVVRIGAPISGEGDGVVPRLALKYSFDPDRMVYASAGKGFRGGGPGAAAAELQTPQCLIALERAGISPGGSFTSDEVKSYELGTKTRWADRRVSADLSLFHIDWSNLQTNLIMNNFNPGCGITVNTNAGDATSQGAELSLSAAVTDRLYFTTAVTYVDATLGDPPVGVAVGKKGDRLQNAPEWQATMSGNYDFPILDSRYKAFVRTDLSYYGDQISQQAFQDDPFFQVPARFVVNARLGFQPSEGSWTAEFYLNNAFNEEIIFGAQALFGEPFTNQALVGRPRTIGFVLRNRW